MRDQKECSTSDESGSVEFQTVKRWVAASALPVNSIERNRKANPIQRLDCGRKEILCYGNGRDFEESMKTMTRGHASPAREESLIRSGRADRGSRRAKDCSQFCSCRVHHGSTRNRKFPKKFKIKGKKPPRAGPKGGCREFRCKLERRIRGQNAVPVGPPAQFARGCSKSSIDGTFD